MHKTEIQVRFSDIDMAGHVHNGVYLSYFEQGRVDFFKSIIGEDWNWKKKGVVLGRNEVDYLKTIKLNDHVFVNTWCEHVGNKSFTLAYELYKVKEGKEILCTKGRTILVCMDFENDVSVPLFEEWKELLENSLSKDRK